MFHQPGTAEVVAASYRLESLRAVADELLPTLAAAANANFLFLHRGSSCGNTTVVTWPPADDVLERYHQDYVTDNPFEPIKMASREPVVPITRRLSRKQLTKTAFYSDLLRPADLEHHAEIRLTDAPGPHVDQSGIIICRDRRAAEFSDSDLRMLASLRPSLMKAAARADSIERALDRADALQAMLTLGDPRAIRMAVDVDGRELHLHGPIAHTDADVIAQLRDEAHPLRRLAAEVASRRTLPAHMDAAQGRFVSRSGLAFNADVAAVPNRFMAILTLTPAASPLAKPAWGLSRAESSVLEEIVAGRSNDDIGQRLGISPDTVRTHLTRIYRKMGVRSRLAAAALARSRA
jgi:DNA-binding CsgD family transcriptional regulator